MSRYTIDELEMLTDEEREGLEAEQEPGDTTEDSTQKEDAPEPAIPATQTEDAPENGKTQETDAEKSEYVPVPEYTKPANTDARLVDIKSELKDLAQRFDEGDLSATEMVEAEQQLRDEQRDLEHLSFKAEFARDQQVNHWLHKTVPDFIEAHPEYRDNETALTALDTAVKKIQRERPDDMFDGAILKKAHEQIAADLLRMTGTTRTKSDTAQQAALVKNRDMPPSLSNVPAADTSDVDEGGKASYLDRLAEQNPLKYEEELARLSDSERENYLAWR